MHFVIITAGAEQTAENRMPVSKGAALSTRRGRRPVCPAEWSSASGVIATNGAALDGKQIRNMTNCQLGERAVSKHAAAQTRASGPTCASRNYFSNSGSFHGFESGIQRLDFYRRFDKHQGCAAESLVLSKNQGQIAADVRICDGDDRERIGSYIFRDI